MVYFPLKTKKQDKIGLSEKHFSPALGVLGAPLLTRVEQSAAGTDPEACWRGTTVAPQYLDAWLLCFFKHMSMTCLSVSSWRLL